MSYDSYMHTPGLGLGIGFGGGGLLDMTETEREREREREAREIFKLALHTHTMLDYYDSFILITH